MKLVRKNVMICQKLPIRSWCGVCFCALQRYPIYFSLLLFSLQYAIIWVFFFKSRPMSWRKGSPTGGEDPATFQLQKCLNPALQMWDWQKHCLWVHAFFRLPTLFAHWSGLSTSLKAKEHCQNQKISFWNKVQLLEKLGRSGTPPRMDLNIGHYNPVEVGSRSPKEVVLFLFSGFNS